MFFKKISLVTGGFDPIHSGHISYFKRAKDFSDYLVVGINTEEWLTRKKGQYFQSWVERAEIIRHLEMVDAVVSWEDDEVGSACGAIAVFCNGGDRGSTNTPELDMYGENPRVQFEFGVGGDDKMNSSSWILKGYFERQRKLLGI
jgi:D-beta-D-heptose 7-phosphate kinase/D-beta-D-heptose 1-phosphate adenosyltransferase